MNAQSERICVDLGTSHFMEANASVRAALEKNDTVRLENVFAQRYLGCAMPDGKRLEIHGTPGNDMACFMDGGDIEVFGNAQDQIGNTMNGGRIVVHGRCGDAAGYAMRGGTIFIRDDCGWRGGINMKQYKDRCPKIVIGGNAGSFLGEYMAGGVIVLMGNPGAYIASGMHGGTIYLQNAIDEKSVAENLVLERVDETDIPILKDLLDEYCRHFENDACPEMQNSKYGITRDASQFYKLCPKSSRPYASMYAN